MAVEHEIKILDIDTGLVSGKLDSLDLSGPALLEFRRYVYDTIPQKNGTFLRLRTDGNKTTLTLKKFMSDSIDGTHEYEVIVDNFDDTHELLTNLGYVYTAYQENRRTLYKGDNIEISIDEWPHIPAYLEIEGKDVDTVKHYIEKLGLAGHNSTSNTPKHVYWLYSLDLDSYKHLSF
jgi:adenylate cyclase, class 2